jgi:transposase InsO family protein
MDLFGPITYISIGGSKYYLVIVDDYSCFTWVFFLQKKSQTQETLKGFLRRAQNEFGLRVKKIRSDNRTEFKNSQIEGFLEDDGIKHEFSSPYTPQQNVKGKCALGPFLSILVIECQHKCFCVDLCNVVDKVQIMSKGMFLDLVHYFMD